ncbi:MAG: HEAT repeat domain-containing protein [Firmicutes bacterium]|nr:HEAT repeat domain-containing protein [Bacillota bacterium]
MSGRLKEAVASLLKEQRYQELAELVAGRRGTLRYLYRLLYDTDNLLRWRAIEGMGAVADRLAGEDPEAVRVILRNLLWSINDESGGIGWSAPECVGEIIYRRPEMFPEFASIILSFADEPMLRRGVVWAAGRIAEKRPDLVREDAPRLTAFLDDPDPVVRGYTLRFLGIIGERPDFDRHRHLLDDRSAVPLYQNGQLKEVTVAGLASNLK